MNVMTRVSEIGIFSNAIYMKTILKNPDKLTPRRDGRSFRSTETFNLRKEFNRSKNVIHLAKCLTKCDMGRKGISQK